MMAKLTMQPTLVLDEGDREAIFLALEDVLNWDDETRTDTSYEARDLRLDDALKTLRSLHTELARCILKSDQAALRDDRDRYFRRRSQQLIQHTIEAAE